MSKIERAMIEEARAKNDSDSPPQLKEGWAKFVICTKMVEDGSLRVWMEIHCNDVQVYKHDAKFLRAGDALTYELDIPYRIYFS